MAPPPQQGSQPDNSAGILWGIAGIFAALGIIWYGFKIQIITFYLTIKLYEVDFLTSLAPHLHLPPNYTYFFDQLRSTIVYALANPGSVNFNDLLSLGISVGDWLRIPIIIFLFVLAVIVYIGNSTHIYRHIYSMRELAKLEKVNWPQITPVIDLDLVKTDIDTGPWAMAMTPLQFCKHHKLLQEVRPQRREGMSRKEWDRIDVVLIRGAANKLFTMQLGPLWKGTDKLSPHARALFAVFAARKNEDTKPAADILTQLNLSSTSSSLNMSGVDALLKKHENTKAIQEIVQAHAYVLTVMASMLEAARQDGVQASADFLWLKPLDRRLWYVLNTVGRQTPFIEVAGIFAHWVAEKEASRRLVVPMIEEATNAVELALKEVLYKPDAKE